MTPEAVELDWLKRWNLYSPQNVAIQCGEDARSLTYGDLYRQSQNLAEVLEERFYVEKGDRVVCIAQNELEVIVLFFAVQRLGAILVPINFRLTLSEINHIVTDAAPKLLVANEPFLKVLQSLKGNFSLWALQGADSLAEACQKPALHEREMAADFEDVGLILYTSGTTGFPKGAMISHRMIFWNSINTGLRLNLTQNDCVLTFLPLFHTGGWNVLTTPCLHRGAKVVLLKKFDADLILDLCEKEKVSVLFGVPTTMAFLKSCARFEQGDFSAMRYAIVGGEPMPLPLIQEWEDKGVPIRQGYGLTEFGPNVFSLNEADSRRKMGSIGFPNFYIEARVVRADGDACAPDEVGELVLKGPVAMSGYWNNPKATEEVFKDGWVHTGDLVRKDKDGYFFVVGRKKEMFISGGENVYPAEVERVLRAFPGVSEAAVVGVKDERWGESGRAFIASVPGKVVAEEALKDHCRAHLAKFKVPQEFVFLKELPKTESGKIAKKALKEVPR
jgi:fatty-acyl-CoA synthase